jgi:hypothetical protein
MHFCFFTFILNFLYIKPDEGPEAPKDYSYINPLEPTGYMMHHQF